MWGLESQRTSNMYINAGLSQFNPFTLPYVPNITLDVSAQYHYDRL